MVVSPPTSPDGSATASEVERSRLDAIRNRLSSPDAYIEYQRLAGRVLFERLAR